MLPNMYRCVQFLWTVFVVFSLWQVLGKKEKKKRAQFHNSVAVLISLYIICILDQFPNCYFDLSPFFVRDHTTRYIPCWDVVLLQLFFYILFTLRPFWLSVYHALLMFEVASLTSCCQSSWPDLTPMKNTHAKLIPVTLRSYISFTFFADGCHICMFVSSVVC